MIPPRARARHARPPARALAHPAARARAPRAPPARPPAHAPGHVDEQHVSDGGIVIEAGEVAGQKEVVIVPGGAGRVGPCNGPSIAMLGRHPSDDLPGRRGRRASMESVLAPMRTTRGRQSSLESSVVAVTRSHNCCCVVGDAAELDNRIENEAATPLEVYGATPDAAGVRLPVRTPRLMGRLCRPAWQRAGW